jgi:hypothetical protein
MKIDIDISTGMFIETDMDPDMAMDKDTDKDTNEETNTDTEMEIKWVFNNRIYVKSSINIQHNCLDSAFFSQISFTTFANNALQVLNSIIYVT